MALWAAAVAVGRDTAPGTADVPSSWESDVAAQLLALPADAVAQMRGQSQLGPMLRAACKAWGCTPGGVGAAEEDGREPAVSHLFLL